ncbi:unnamed protein product [Clavelina lepadiformis]|uniref:Uncharacterized protein n=1 Tax=Clavelina lepadiformis TaxID=159417 RepID=A0ABP0FIY1_CLALP
MVGRGFPRAFTPVNIQSGFKVAGIYPLDSDIFTDAEFLPSDVNDRSIPMDVADSASTQPTDQQATSQQHQISDRSSSSTIDCLMNVTLESIKPFTKAAPRKRKSNINRGRTRILTDTSEKQELMAQIEKKKKTNGDVTFKFLKRSSHSKLVSERPSFIFPMDTDESEFTQNLKDIVFKWPVPLNRRGRKRSQQKFVFPVDLSGYNPQKID